MPFLWLAKRTRDRIKSCFTTERKLYNELTPQTLKQTCCAGKLQSHRYQAILELLYFSSLETLLPVIGRKIWVAACPQPWSLTGPYSFNFLPTLFLVETKSVQKWPCSMELAPSLLHRFKTAFHTGNKRVIYLVSKRLVNFVHQPGESASVYRLSKRVPGVGCLLQVQRADELHAQERKATQQPFHSEIMFP